MALSAFESIFKDDPFFEQASFVWPLQRTPLTSRLMQDGRSLREDFFNRRAHLVRSLSNQMSSSRSSSSASTLLGELCQGLPLPSELLQSLDQLQLQRAGSSSPASSNRSSGSGSPAPSSAPSTPTPSYTPTPTSSMGMVAVPTACTALQPAFENRDSTLTLNAQGFSPDDIRVTVSGRQLEVMATKKAETGDSASMSNGNVHCATASSQRRQQGFIQRVTLPEGVDAADIFCSLGDDGMLRIQTKPRDDASNASTSLPPTPTPTPTPPPPTPFGLEKNASFKLDDALGAARVQQEEEAPVRYRTSLDFNITKSPSSSPTVETTFRKSN